MIARRRIPRPTTFLWQGLMILLPVILLVVVHFKVLMFDRVMAEHEAQQQSQALADELVERLWHALTDPSPESGRFPSFEVDANGLLMAPTPFPQRPEPRPLDLSVLNASQADLWRHLESQSALGNGTPDEALHLVQQFLAQSPPARFVELARYQLGSALARQGHLRQAVELLNQVGRDDLHAVGETGLPLYPLAQFKVLDLQNQAPKDPLNAAALIPLSPGPESPSWREPDVRHVLEQVLAHPSALTPWFMDRLAEAVPAGPLTNTVAEFQRQWHLQETSRKLYACAQPALRIEPPIVPLLTPQSAGAPATTVIPTLPNRGRPRLFWVECPVPKTSAEWYDPVRTVSQSTTTVSSDPLDPDRALAYPTWQLHWDAPEPGQGTQPNPALPGPDSGICKTWLAAIQDLGRNPTKVVCYPALPSSGSGVPLASWPAPVTAELARFAKHLPPHLGLSLEVAGRTLLSSNHLPLLVRSAKGKGGGQSLAPYSGPKAAPPQVLGSARKSDAGGDYLQANIHLLSPTLIYARQRERSRWFSLLVTASAVVAAIGFASARRAFLRRQRLAELQTNFVSSVSHELRAPIASVRLMAEGLDRGTASTPEKQREYFGLIVQECRRLSAMIENVLDFARIEQNRKEYEREPTDLGRLVSETLKLMEPVSAQHQVRLEWQPPVMELPQPNLDGRAIQQALVNLLDNAIKHAPPGTAVTVALQSLPGAIRLSVTDHGPGIPASEHEKIFDRFYRLGSELRRETQGVGIGLSIVKHIAQGHHGRVWVESTLGQGSRFHLELPLDTASPYESAHPHH